LQAQAIVDHRFVLETQWRRGGMGTVWKAHDLRTQATIALKVLHEGAVDQVERFIREGALLADLRHPNIVSYVGHGTIADGTPYLAMEWLEGETVAERLARQRLTLLESLALLRGTLRALSVAHRRGIVHRDVKPSNLFLRRGRIEDVVLLDLGVARHLEASSDLTRTGSILGTPSYMAPEQAQAHREVTPSADVFSLGCVLFECLTGTPPFVGSSVFSVLAKVLFEEPPRLGTLRAEIPAVIEALVDDMLTKDPARRPRDAEAVLARLDALGATPDLPAPGAVSQRPRSPGAEQELVSVILALPPGPTESPERPAASGDLSTPDLSIYDAQVRRLVNGTTLMTLAQRGGSATDLAARAARCAMRLRADRTSGKFVIATGRGIPSERIHIGEAVDRAGLMLRALAERDGGAIWLDEVTTGLLDARFQAQRLQENEGGPAGAVEVSVLIGEDPSTDPGRRLLGRPTTCIGRDHELAILKLTLRACIEESSPRAILVSGPPGIGKSRLRHELLRHTQVGEPQLTVLVGLGDPIRTAGTRGLLGNAIARLCGIRSDGTDEENREALAERVGRHLSPAGDRLRTIVFMGELCGTPYPEEALPELRAARHSPSIMADMLTQAWVAFSRAEATQRPVLVVLDDLQWSDALTISLVGAALRSLASSPLMVLALGRPEVAELFPNLWAPRLTTLPLPSLGAAAAARLIRQVLGPDALPEVVERIVNRAGGNALYLEELIRAAEANRDAVPGTVLAMLQARIGLLPAPVRRVLRAASVFGEDFPVAGVESLLEAAGTPDTLEEVLATLDNQEIVEQQPDEAGATRWRFRHALMRDAAYGLFTSEDLATWHGLAARVLETAGEDPAVIASHYERSGDRGLAVRHYIAAADRTYERSELAATVTLVERGLSCGAAGPERGILRSIETAARFFRNEMVASASASKEALELLPAGHLRRTQSLAWSTYTALHVGNGGEVAAHVDELLAIEPVPTERASYVRALGDVFISHAVLANRAEATRLLARLEQIDAHAGADDPLTHGHVKYWTARFLELLGDDPYAAWTAAKASTLAYQRSGDRRMLAFAQVEIGECARRLFSVEDGLATMRQAVALAKVIQEAVTTSFVQQYLATLLAEHGADEQLGEARAAAQEVLEQSGGSVYAAFGHMALALTDLRAGDTATAEGHARQARDLIRRIGLRALFPHADGTLLQILVGKGDGSSASALADEILMVVDREGPMGTIEMSVRLVAARAHLLAGRRDDAIRGVQVALAGLARRAASIPEPAMRARFFSHVPEHAALLVLGRELGI